MIYYGQLNVVYVYEDTVGVFAPTSPQTNISVVSEILFYYYAMHHDQ